MESVWIINFKDGGQLCMTEEAYKEYKQKSDLEKVGSEEHWFDKEKAKERYSWI